MLSTFARKFDPELHWTRYKEELQMLASGIVSIVMGVGNFLSTWATINEKQGKAKLKRVSEQDEGEGKTSEKTIREEKGEAVAKSRAASTGGIPDGLSGGNSQGKDKEE